MKAQPANSQQEELQLSSIAAHALFPGRTVLYVAEVAKALQMDQRQVVDLIEEYRDTEGKSGLAAINIGSGLKREGFDRGNKTPRNYWRVPVSAFDAFVSARKNNQPTTAK
jgi:hypothetical protein